MRNKFTITISDVSGSKHFTLHQIIKKFIAYFLLFIFCVILVGAFLIRFLMDEVKDLQEIKSKILSQKEKLVNENKILQESIEQKTKQFDEIQDKVADIEELIGLKTKESDIDIDQRVDILSLTSAQRRLIFDNIPNGYPIEYKGISAKFGWRIHPILKRKEFHRGLDLRGSMGTPVHAPADGIVEFAGYHKKSGFGNLLIIQHNYGFKTYYAHLKKILVKVGDLVKKGDIVAKVGSSGLSTGPHLHYEVRFIGRALDPMNFVKWSSSNFDNIFKKEKRVSWQSLIRMLNSQYQLPKQLSLRQEQK